MPPAAPPHATARERVPYLDGLRAIAIIGVLCDHTLLSPGFPASVRAVLPDAYVCGNLGVHLFFVISGFIITHLLIVEEQRTGRVSLAQFWGRRAARILPPLVVFLAGVFALSRFEARIRPPLIDFVMALTFTKFILSDFHSWWLGHTWSLSIEEQFYLIWPLVFLLPAGRRLGLTLIFTGSIALASLWFFHRDYDRWQWMLPGNCGYLVAGCLLATLRDRFRFRLPPRPAVSSVIVVFAVAVLGVTHSPLMANRTWGILVPLNSFLAGLGVALIIELLLEERLSGFGWVLEQRAVKWLGWISYSLYLWQQVLLGPDGFWWVQRFPQNLLFAMMLAVGSYYAIEGPCRAAYRRLSCGGA